MQINKLYHLSKFKWKIVFEFIGVWTRLFKITFGSVHIFLDAPWYVTINLMNPFSLVSADQCAQITSYDFVIHTLVCIFVEQVFRKILLLLISYF